jgi:hypothetical protein
MDVPFLVSSCLILSFLSSVSLTSIITTADRCAILRHFLLDSFISFFCHPSIITTTADKHLWWDEPAG